jgi:apolipoprotein N-acyltransferase
MTLLTATLDDDGPRARLILRFGRIGLALAAGAATALAHPPFGFLPGLLGYALLMFLAERATSVRGAFWMGWLAGFAYFFISCWWVAEAFLINPAQAWMAPFAASLLPIGLGLFWGTATALYRRFLPGGVRRVPAGRPGLEYRSSRPWPGSTVSASSPWLRRRPSALCWGRVLARSVSRRRRWVSWLSRVW